MEKILLITEDLHGLGKEVAAALPKGYKLETMRPEKTDSASGYACIAIDIDSVDLHLIREFSEKSFVLSLTRQNMSGPVMEAAIWGSYEIMRRPVEKERLTQAFEELRGLREEMRTPVVFSPETVAPAATCVVIGRSALIISLCEKIARLAQIDLPVLITGETGTGKELVAEAIMQLSDRYGKPFVVINSAAVPDALLESELFGHERGAFTGAVATKKGMLRIADEGSVFFDEIGEMPLSIQGKLLRFLETRTFYPVGSTKEVKVNVRVISATNRDLAAMVRQGKFREDLYHRLRVASIHVPPLRERKKDITPLVQCLFERHVVTSKKPIKGVTQAFLDKLHAYDWPGNIRELENTIRSAIGLCKTDYLTTHELKDLGQEATVKQAPDPGDAMAAALIPYLKRALEQREKNIYKKVHAELDRYLFRFLLEHTRENISVISRLMGIHRMTLKKKLASLRSESGSG